MDALSPLPALAALFLALVTSFFITKLRGAPPTQGRFSSIDGLRGYLAFFVFLHHAAIWFDYLRTGEWRVPPSNLYTHFGQSSVVFFFMITGFLFFLKILDGRTNPIDWGKLFMGRFLRLLPLYLLMLTALLLIVVVLSGGTVSEPTPILVKQLIHWLGFTITGAPDINAIKHTSAIVAGVTWSLPYEVFFYLSLPVLAAIVGVVPPRAYLAYSLLGAGMLLVWRPEGYHLLAFLGGMIAAVLVRSGRFQAQARHGIASLVAVGCVGAVVMLFSSAYSNQALLLMFIAFTLIAMGNGLFGSLTHPVSRTLGEFAYSIYLLHGIVLFVVFTFILGKADAKELSATQHWLVVMGATPVLIVITSLTFRFIEQPAMQSTTALTAWLRSVPHR